MRRPVKYKTRQAAQKRILTAAVAAVLGVGVIGGAAAAVILNRDDEGNIGIGTGSDTAGAVISDTADSGIADSTDTAQSTDTAAEDTTPAPGTETEPLQTEPAVTEPAATEPVVTEPTPVVTEPPADNPPQTEITGVASTKNYKGGYLDLSDYPTTTSLKTAADALKADGYTAVMVELKYDNGKLAYKSEVAEAVEFGANPSVAALALDDIVDVLHNAGLYVTGRVCAFRDDLAAKGNSALALMNTAGFRYSDGASRWISVYTTAGQDYLLALLNEMEDAGVDEVMLRDFALPADAGTTAPKHEVSTGRFETVESFVKRISTECAGLSLNLEIDVETLAAGSDDETYINCEALAPYTDSITADITLSNLRDGMSIGGKTIADVDADPAKTVDTVLSALDGVALNIRPLIELTGNASVDAAQIAAAQNRGYGAYQMTARVISMTEK